MNRLLALCIKVSVLLIQNTVQVQVIVLPVFLLFKIIIRYDYEIIK